MDIRFLTPMEFHSVHFFRSITLAILLAMAGLTLAKLSGMTSRELALLLPCLLVMGWRFAVEWFRVASCGPASIHNGELIIASAKRPRRIALRDIRSVTTAHSIFMVRRYRSWSEHLAFLKVTLNNGEIAYTLIESAVFELPAGKQTLTELQAAILNAKVKSP